MTIKNQRDETKIDAGEKKIIRCYALLNVARRHPTLRVACDTWNNDAAGEHFPQSSPTTTTLLSRTRRCTATLGPRSLSAYCTPTRKCSVVLPCVLSLKHIGSDGTTFIFSGVSNIGPLTEAQKHCQLRER